MAQDYGRVNVYTCTTCRRHIVTRDRDEGTTPFGLACRATEGCQGTMRSACYRVDQTQVATWEFFSPRSSAERRKITPELADHVKMGGLLLRSLAH